MMLGLGRKISFCPVDIDDASKEVDLIIEAVPENIDLKKSVFRDLDKLAPSESVLATNTSALSILKLHPQQITLERVIGMHFLQPSSSNASS